jgi:hypothetical protein
MVEVLKKRMLLSVDRAAKTKGKTIGPHRLIVKHLI